MNVAISVSWSWRPRLPDAFYVARVIALLVLLLSVAFLVWGCAPKGSPAEEPLPYCARFRVQTVQLRDGSTVYVFDEENIEKLLALLEGLPAGTCRPHPPATPS